MKNIFLLGPKHSGKTSAGTALAALCSCVFIDLDELVAEQSGKSPRALYTEGPEIFKKAEAAALASLMEKNDENSMRVIAAGGGIADNPSALALLETAKTDSPAGSGIGVFIRVSAKTAWERIRLAGELPPFLRTENPEETHRALHERRSAAYQKIAGIVIDAEGQTPQEIAGELHTRLIQRGFFGGVGFFA